MGGKNRYKNKGKDTKGGYNAQGHQSQGHSTRGYNGQSQNNHKQGQEHNNHMQGQGHNYNQGQNHNNYGQGKGQSNFQGQQYHDTGNAWNTNHSKIDKTLFLKKKDEYSKMSVDDKIKRFKIKVKRLEGLKCWRDYGGVESTNQNSKQDDINNRIILWKGDITQLAVDVIVNATNDLLNKAGGVDSAIREAAGKMIEDEISLNRSEAVALLTNGVVFTTDAYRLPSKYVAHVAGPVFDKSSDTAHCAAAHLESSYSVCLDTLRELQLNTIAFPCISTGNSGFPLYEATKIAITVVRDFLSKYNEIHKVVFCVYDDSDLGAYQRLLSKYCPRDQSTASDEGEDEIVNETNRKSEMEDISDGKGDKYEGHREKGDSHRDRHRDRDDSHGDRNEGHRDRDDSHGDRNEGHRDRDDSHGDRNKEHWETGDSQGDRSNSFGHRNNSNGGVNTAVGRGRGRGKDHSSLASSSFYSSLNRPSREESYASPGEVAKDRDYFLSLRLDQKQKLYSCGDNFVPYDKLPSWDKMVRGQDPGHHHVNNDINDRVALWQGDITKLQIDAIVNAANTALLGGGGVDGAIHKAAGHKLLNECRLLKGCKTGEAKTTAGYRLPATYVIHTVGPINQERHLLENAYANSLDEMVRHNLTTIAFPCISTGVYGYPPEEAATIALTQVKQFLQKHPKVERVVFCVFLDQDRMIYEWLMEQVFPVSDDNEEKQYEKYGNSGENEKGKALNPDAEPWENDQYREGYGGDDDDESGEYFEDDNIDQSWEKIEKTRQSNRATHNTGQSDQGTDNTGQSYRGINNTNQSDQSLKNSEWQKESHATHQSDKASRKPRMGANFK